MKKFWIISGLTLIVFSLMYISLVLTQTTRKLIPNINRQNTREGMADINYHTLLPYTQIIAKSNDETIPNKPYIIFTEDLLRIKNKQMKFSLHVPDDSNKKNIFKIHYSGKGGLKMLSAKKQERSKDNTWNIFFKYQYLNNFFPKFLYIQFIFPKIETDLILPVVREDQTIAQFAKLQITKDNIVIAVPRNYKIIWVTNGYNRFFTRIVKPNKQGNIWIYSYSINNNILIPSFVYIYYQNKYAIIKIPAKNIIKQLDKLINNNYQLNKFKLLKDIQGIKYKVIGRYLVLATSREYKPIQIATNNKDLTTNLYFWNNNNITAPRTFYYLNLQKFSQKEVTFNIKTTTSTGAMNIKIPQDTITLGAIPITLTKAQFFALIISLSLILSNFLYYAIEAFLNQDECTRPIERKSK